MGKVYIFGHKKPDTDSVTAAINLSYLKNKLGQNTIPMVLGNINNETKFALKYFGFDIPQYLNDVKLQIKDLNYWKKVFVNKDISLYDAFNYMSDKSISNIPVVDNDEYFLGTISIKNIARDLILDYFDKLYTTFDNIISVLKGETLLRFDDTIEGNIIIASYRSTTFIENIELNSNDILIVGDRHSIIEYAVKSKVKLLVLTGSSKIKDEHLEIARKNHVNIIRTNYNTYMTTKNIALSKPISSIMNNNDIVFFNENDDVNDFIDLANKTKHSNFPVVDSKNKCLGIIKLADIADKERKKVILVDHNEYEQSVDGLDEAEIMEIIDHHKIGSIGTNAPINFRNMPVGSTNTILYMMFKENNVEIPKNYAGLMLSGILSDTLLFISPTTTELDKDVATKLAKKANVDYKKYAMEMFKASSSLKGKTHEEIFYTDFKNFIIDNKKIGISQISTINADDIIDNSQNYIDIMNELAKNNEYYMVILFVTDIISKGSYIFFNDNVIDVLDNCFGKNIEQGSFLEGITSRKKQVIPVIMDKIKSN